MQQISISIVLYKTDIHQLTCIINCITSSTIPSKLYLVDNSPTNDIKDLLQECIKQQNIEYIFNNKNLGYGAGHNVAIRKSIDKSKYHLVLNADIHFGKDVLEKIYEYMEFNKAVGQLIPKVLYPNGKLQYVCKLLPTPFNLISRLFPGNIFKRYNNEYELKFTGYNRIMNVPYLQGSFMFLRMSALKEIGLFDERFFMYPEDIDLTRRMHEKYKTVYYPEVSIYHEHAKTSFKNYRLFLIHAFNIIKYFNKWGWFFDKERSVINRNTLKNLRSIA